MDLNTSVEHMLPSEMHYLSERVCARRESSSEPEPEPEPVSANSQIVPNRDVVVPRKNSLIAIVLKLLLLVYHASQHYKIKYNVGPQDDDYY